MLLHALNRIAIEVNNLHSFSIYVMSCSTRMTLTHLCPTSASTIIIKWMNLFVNEWASGLVYLCHFHFIVKKNTKLPYAKSVDPNQTPRFVASDRGLHCLFVYVLQ